MRLQVEYVSPNDLTPAPYNPRTISERAMKALARLLDEHGFVDPVIARREDNLIIGGHQRIRANEMRRRPDDLVPCVFLENVSDAQAKAMNVALNNTDAQGRFDEEMLAALLVDVQAAGMDVSAATGFSGRELEDLERALGGFEPAEGPDPAGAADESPPDTGTDNDDEVLVVFEMTCEQYARVRPELDGLIDRHDLTCHVQINGEA